LFSSASTADKVPQRYWTQHTTTDKVDVGILLPQPLVSAPHYHAGTDDKNR
jgi:hypothetical protein